MTKDEKPFLLENISANFSSKFDCYVLLSSIHKTDSHVSAKTTNMLINMLPSFLLMRSFGKEYSDLNHVFPLFQGHV